MEHSFQEVMKQWRRMCDTVQAKNQERSNEGWCYACPIQGYCYLDSSIKDSYDSEFQRVEQQVIEWAKQNSEPVYETWFEYLQKIIPHGTRESELGFMALAMRENIRPDIAEKLGLKPKDIDNGT